MKPKRQQGAANHRDTRHENGLVGPGKRVLKEKSNGHLNGHAKTPDSIPSTPSLPATPPRASINGHARSSHDLSVDHNMGVEASRRPSVSSYQESSSSESYHNLSATSGSQENHRQINEINVNALKNPAVHRDNGPLSFALTVLRSCPLGDTIAILIVLLQLPPACLSIIHLLFATLTFVPPTSPANSALSLTDIFEGTLGTPSVAVIVVIDAFVLLVWIMLWSPLQDMLLDLAQSVIALTLGGGTSGRTGGMNNVLVCFGVIGVSHFARDDNMKSSSLGMLISSSSGRLFGSPDPDDPLEAPTSGRKKSATAHGWIRSVLAIHILTQGVVRYIRDWYVRREKRDSTAAAIGDPEAGNGALVAPTNDNSTPTIQGPENEPPNPAAVSHTVVTSKKKRKQSAQVRLRQPLWAALASTKVVMVKEYETSHTAAESVGANATGINDLGNAPFNAEADQVWITYVGFDEVYFSTSYFPSYTLPENYEQKKDTEFDRSKPFYVRVNNTTWQPTRINVQTDPDQSPGQDTRWSGEIFGLAPMSSYQCDFVSTIDGTVIFSTAVRTIKAPTADMAAASTLSPNVQIQGRPNSPTTTLRTSIASSEAKLNEERNRQRRERKDQRAKLNAARKEIEKVVGNIASSGGNDDRLRQKVLQSKLHMKQAEDALASLATQIETLESIPTDDSSEWKYEKEAFHSQRELHKQSRQDFNHVKAAAERDIQALTTELAALQQKRERMQGRIAKLNTEHERIADANAKGLDEAQRKARDREAKGIERANLELLYIQRGQSLAEEIQNTEANCQATFATITALQEAMYAVPSPTAALSNTQNPYDIPEGTMQAPSNYPWNPQLPAYFAINGTLPRIGQQSTRTRGRSSSMLSDVSGFTHWDDAEPQSQSRLSAEAPDFGFGSVGSEKERQKSDDTSSASGSGSASRNGSAGDPKSPLAAKSASFRWGAGIPGHENWATTIAVDEKL